MQKVLITGATGNVGLALLKALAAQPANLEIFAGVRDVQTDSPQLSQFPVTCIPFDFLDQERIAAAFDSCDILFLLRPPQLADVESVFKPLVDLAKAAAIQHLIFLSVQGAETNSVIPHHKIEKLVVDSGIPYTFLRPAYFMQNFTTTLLQDLLTKDEIYLPAGKAKFTLVDVEDIGGVAAHVILAPESFRNQALILTAAEAMTFGEMATQLTEALGRKITFISPNLLSFFLRKRKEGMAIPFILVMIMLHFLPRFQQTPRITQTIQEVLGRAPISFLEFVNRNKSTLKK